MDATSTALSREEQRSALSVLTTLLVLDAALADRIVLLLQTRDHPSVDSQAWDALIDEAKSQHEQMLERIDALRTKLGIGKLH
ncbi:MAG: hypothetical protein H0U98_08870 [Alphaproteobacteria bacterium]|nr:hypothetical protein [Alphaproteobacteria bacterium]